MPSYIIDLSSTARNVILAVASAMPRQKPAQANGLNIGGREVPVTNLEKVLYPGRRFKKAQVIDYFIRVARYLLPHLRDRPVTLKRYPDGVTGDAFYEKAMPREDNFSE